jgi:hypothetical protein
MDTSRGVKANFLILHFSHRHLPKRGATNTSATLIPSEFGMRTAHAQIDVHFRGFRPCKSDK